MSAAQLFYLEKLAEGPASSIADLAARTLTDRSSVSVVVDRLAAAGFVSRLPSRNDRRRTETRINDELGYTDAAMLFEEPVGV